MENPLAPSQDAITQAKRDALAAKAAQARSAGEWFDIFVEICTDSVKTIQEGHGASAREALMEWTDDLAAVRRDFEAHGLPLTEDIDIEGPQQDPSRPSDQLAIIWPMGEWANFYWPDGSKLSFRGKKALIAFSFILWWDSFHQAYKIRQGGDDGAGQSRMIAPGSPEWNEYYSRKNADIKKGLV